MKYTGFINFLSRLDHKKHSIECGTFDDPAKCHAQMERIIPLIAPMNGQYSTYVVEHS